MTLSHPFQSDSAFLIVGITASAILHAALFIFQTHRSISTDFAVQPSNFALEISLMETSSGQPEPTFEEILTSSSSSTETEVSTPSALPAPTAPNLLPSINPNLNKNPKPSANLPPSHASSTVLASPNASRNSAPIYPEIARKNGWAGTILLQAKISAQGSVESLTIRQSTGHDVLDQSATKAVRQWHFHPQKVNGNPVAVTVELPVKFSLNQ
jgi:TonB family protein